MKNGIRQHHLSLVFIGSLVVILAAAPVAAQVEMVEDINSGAGASSTGNGATAFGSKILFSAMTGPTARNHG